MVKKVNKKKKTFFMVVAYAPVSGAAHAEERKLFYENLAEMINEYQKHEKVTLILAGDQRLLRCEEE